MSAELLQERYPHDWTYSPLKALEQTLQAVRSKYPAQYPTDLTRLNMFLDKLGNPHHRLPFVFHVAGTNGKGSSLAFLQAIFEAAGKKVHKYISPHLVRFEERIILSGKMIDPDLLLQLIRECDCAADGREVSFFEFITAVAFATYARFPADVLLLETGLGGLYDATNVVAGDRIVSLLTRISYDHTHVLGKTLKEIAAHKAGIIKPGRPVVIGRQTSSEAMDVFLQRSSALGAPAFLQDRHWTTALTRQGFSYKSPRHTFNLPLPRLQGRHQVDNAGLALAALEASPYAPLLQQTILEQAMGGVLWEGRLQRIMAGPLARLLPADFELWVDGAHNDSAAEILIDQARAWGTDKPLHLVTAMKRTKDVSGFYRGLLAHVATVQAVDVGWIEAPMMPAEVLCDQIRKIDEMEPGKTPSPHGPRIRVSANLESALRALAFQFKAPQRILITGSLYLVGHALKGSAQDRL